MKLSKEKLTKEQIQKLEAKKKLDQKLKSIKNNKEILK
jgi:hypothetical protein